LPLLSIWAPSWGWVIAANVLLGVNQGMTWSTTVIMTSPTGSPATTPSSVRAGPTASGGGAGNDAVSGGPQRDFCRGDQGHDAASGCEVRTGFP
jgi:hypothetical protein